MRPAIWILAAALGAAGLCLWIALHLGEVEMGSGAGSGEVAFAQERVSLRSREPQIEAPGSSDPAASTVETLSAEVARAREAGIPPPPPDALVAVHGRVLDAHTGEPVQGITLCFLSRRPRTCTVKTDSEGRFETRPELTSGVVTAAHVPDPESPLLAARMDIEPTTFLAAAPGTPEEGKEIVLAARAPERVLDVDIRLPDGGAAEGAAVSLSWGRRDESGRFQGEGRAYEETDARGRARFALFGPDAWERSFQVEAEHDGTLASDVLVLDPPLGRAPQVLGLHPGGLVRVRARNDEGHPVAGVSLWAATHEDSGSIRGRAGETDARGECVFGALRAGCYSISAVHPSTGEEIRREVDLPRGGQETVDLHLSLSGLRLRLSGTIVDELGYPLPGVAVRAQAGGEAWVALTSGEGGRFEFWGRACDSVLFGAGGGFLDDRYDPELMAVPCGTPGLTVRRLSKLEERSWALEIIDRQTLEPARAACATLFHGDPRASPASMQSFTAASGLVQVSFKLRDDTSYAVDAPGYLREHGPLADLIASGARSGVLRVELDRGFERHVEVRDRVTRRGIVGASLSAGPVTLSRTDEHGAATLHGDDWPVTVRVESPGYVPLAWDPLAAGFPGEVIWLEPLRSGN